MNDSFGVTKRHHVPRWVTDNNILRALKAGRVFDAGGRDIAVQHHFDNNVFKIYLYDDETGAYTETEGFVNESYVINRANHGTVRVGSK